MAYDIYGNLLSRGHCEVHPEVDEEYPCYKCMTKHYELKQTQAEPMQKEPTIMDYIDFKPDEFLALSNKIIQTAQKEDDSGFYKAIEDLVKMLEPEFINSVLHNIK